MPWPGLARRCVLSQLTDEDRMDDLRHTHPSWWIPYDRPRPKPRRDSPPDTRSAERKAADWAELNRSLDPDGRRAAWPNKP